MSHAVASGHDLTTQSACAILAEGGTAVDACIAAALTAFVTEPVLAQPFGGGFMMIVPQDRRPVCMDAFVETPPARSDAADLDIQTITVDFGAALQDFHIGAGTTATPCLIPGLFEAHARYGRLPMRELAAPAVALAREGVSITDFQAYLLSLVKPIYLASDGAAAVFGKDGETLPADTTYVNRDLADVLEVMANEGPRFFAEGEVAQALTGQPGALTTPAALRAAAPVWRAPLTLDRAGSRVALNPPPSLGGVQIALALSALPPDPGPATIARAMAEIVRIRRDTGLDTAPERAEGLLLSPDLVRDLQRILAAHQVSTQGTTHISAIDRDGMGAALTLSNGAGNGRILPGTGIMPNNMLGEEDLVPGGPTSWTPGRRLASMMCPMTITDRQGRLTMLGTGGSNRIRSALTIVALGLIDRGLALDEAIAAARMHMEGQTLYFEDTGGDAMRDALLTDWPEAQAFAQPNLFFGGVHAVRLAASGDLFGAGDPRRSGSAIVG